MTHGRYLPSDDLSFFVEHHWTVRWDLRGREPIVSENLPYPSVHVVFERGRSGVFGVVLGKFARRLEGKGRVLGIKFKPGAFYPFLRSSVSALANQERPLGEVFDVDVRALEERIFAHDEDDANEPDAIAAMIAIAEDFLRERLPDEDPTIAVIGRIVEQIIADRSITKVDDIVARAKTSQTGKTRTMSKRTLQRIFGLYVGASPKWVIMRYRLHEAAEQLAAGGSDWAALALDLGYFDQAHFIKDFKSIVGRSPAEYASGIKAKGPGAKRNT